MNLEHIGVPSAEETSTKRAPGKGLVLSRYFTRPGIDPFDQVKWELRTAAITGEGGQVFFEQKDVEIPAGWSQMATNVVVQKYFRGAIGTDARERSVRQLIGRVVDTITGWGVAQGYFRADADADTFRAELTHLLVEQKMSFNSPVWFNVGVEKHPQCSACFINSVDDTMESILTLAKTEGMLFKFGSGTGTNFSSLRSSREQLQGGGSASGPVSFMKGFDAFAGVIKSGGKTRRAAKMVILNVDHPDIIEYIKCKAAEERKAWTLIDAGYNGSFTGEAYGSIFFQNSNNSVRVTDDFMEAVKHDRVWHTRAVTTGAIVDTYRARDLWRMIAEAAHQCGDPGLQFDTTVNSWHTCPNTARINASNPCVTGDTLVATRTGPRRIDSLLSAPQEVVGSDGSLHPIAPAFSTGRKPVYRLTTKCGYELHLTADHKVYTVNRGDVPVHDLTRDDHIALGTPVFGDRHIDPRLGEYLGLVLGDGCVSGGIVSVTLAPEEADVARRVNDALLSFKIETSPDGRGRRPIQVNQPQDTLRIVTSSQTVVAALSEYAVLDRGSEDKSLTALGLCLDRTSLSAVLRGLFTADGTVADYGEKNQYVSLDLCSLGLLQQVQLLLLQFGIKSKLYRNRRPAGTSLLPDGKGGQREYPVKAMHSLRISRSSRLVFEREIGFIPGSKKLAQLSAMNQGTSCYKDPWHDSVKEVEYLGEMDVYDLTEPVTEHFVAGGLVVHNCSEYMFLDDSACNLASLNLRKFQHPPGSKKAGELDVEAFKHAVEMTILAQEIVVDNARYPTEQIEINSHNFRPLGLGYANLGALLMSRGLPYDSDAGRAYAGAVTALLGGHAYAMSARIARDVTGPFAGYPQNRDPFLGVIAKHRRHVDTIDGALCPYDLLEAARSCWNEALHVGHKDGFRNAQVTVLAPTGTIGFMMDCDTTGVEPDIALVKYKRLVGGGMLKIVNNTVNEALTRLGYDPPACEAIIDHINQRETIEGAPGLRPEHLPVFDCAFRPQQGVRSIHHMGHIKMMAAAQPFLSGAISKTVNLPNECTVEDIESAYMESFSMGLKAVAVYRDGCKRSQPLSTSRKESHGSADALMQAALQSLPAGMRALLQNAHHLSAGEFLQQVAAQQNPRGAPVAVRRKLPDERHSLTHKFSIAGHDGYIHVGMYEDSSPGEIFIRMAKEGSTISGLMDAFATAISLALQHGVPLKLLIDKFTHTRFEPSGWTGNPEIPRATSIMDYIFRWLQAKFLPEERQGEQLDLALPTPDEPPPAAVPRAPIATPAPRPIVTMVAPREPNGHASTMPWRQETDAPTCHECGTIMVRSGACHKCLNCGATSGCS